MGYRLSSTINLGTQFVTTSVILLKTVSIPGQCLKRWTKLWLLSFPKLRILKMLKCSDLLVFVISSTRVSPSFLLLDSDLFCIKSLVLFKGASFQGDPLMIILWKPRRFYTLYVLRGQERWYDFYNRDLKKLMIRSPENSLRILCNTLILVTFGLILLWTVSLMFPHLLSGMVNPSLNFHHKGDSGKEILYPHTCLFFVWKDCLIWLIIRWRMGSGKA